MRLRSLKLWLSCFALVAGLSVSAADDTNAISEIWRVHLSSGVSASSAAVAPDGTIYQGTFDGRMLAISPAGRVQWAFQAGLEIKSSPAVGDDGTVYFGSRDRNFYALTPSGKLKWSFPTGAWVDASPALAADGTIYFGSWDKNFYALAPDGKLKWTFATSNLITASPAIAGDGTVYFGSHDKNFYALNPDGRLKWKFLTGAEIDISASIGADGTVYFGSTDGNLYALRPDGSELWRLRTGSYTASSPVLDAAGALYLAANRNYLSVGHDGKLRWQNTTDISMDQTELVAANGRNYLSVPWLHFGSADRAGNNTAWGFQMDFNMESSPNTGGAGIFYACDGVFLYALQAAGSPLLEKSSWPMWRANPRHTGRVQN